MHDHSTHGGAKTGVEERIRHALRDAAAMLHLEHARMELVRFDRDGLALLDVAGECPDCDVSVATFEVALTAHLRNTVSEVRDVQLVRS